MNNIFYIISNLLTCAYMHAQYIVLYYTIYYMLCTIPYILYTIYTIYHI
jgi:hypothetical protein